MCTFWPHATMSVNGVYPGKSLKTSFFESWKTLEFGLCKSLRVPENSVLMSSCLYEPWSVDRSDEAGWIKVWKVNEEGTRYPVMRFAEKRSRRATVNKWHLFSDGVQSGAVCRSECHHAHWPLARCRSWFHLVLDLHLTSTPPAGNVSCRHDV